MTENTRRDRDHLGPEEVEALALEAGRSLPGGSSAHATRCRRCRRDVEELQRLHAALLALSPLVPASGLADRVMRRVRLPVPWRVRAGAAVARHRVAAVAALGGLAGLVGVAIAWMSRYPEINPVTVTAFIVERSTALLWGAVMGLGRLVYGSGVLSSVQRVVEQMTLGTAFLAALTVTVVGLGALRILLNLMKTAPGARPAIPG